MAKYVKKNDLNLQKKEILEDIREKHIKKFQRDYYCTYCKSINIDNKLFGKRGDSLYCTSCNTEYNKNKKRSSKKFNIEGDKLDEAQKWVDNLILDLMMQGFNRTEIASITNFSKETIAKSLMYRKDQLPTSYNEIDLEGFHNNLESLEFDTKKELVKRLIEYGYIYKEIENILHVSPKIIKSIKVQFFNNFNGLPKVKLNAALRELYYKRVKYRVKVLEKLPENKKE